MPRAAQRIGEYSHLPADGKTSVMHFIVKSFSGGEMPQHAFPVLCKGENSGKPLRNSCPNCFIVICSCDQDKEFLFQLSWGLWMSRTFRPWLTGSVIPFIRIPVYNRILRAAADKASANSKQCAEAIATMQQLEKFIELKLQQVKLSRELQYSIFRKFLK
ncbi:MAG: hypothetical protein KIS94_05665 [Chitinophagales bacterium]|nr:hypothetical protein [Chitinophagales bacterium]